MSRVNGGLIRIVIALGLTMIVGWGTVFYAFGVLAPKMIADTGMSRGFVYGCFSLALLTSGLVAPAAGRLVDRRGGRFVMTIGSCVAAAGCLLVGWSPNMVVYTIAWTVIGAAIPLMLYDPAFATITHAAGRLGSRGLIVQITLFGGLASTVFWPLTHVLDAQFGWRNVWLFCAAANALICAPIHYFVLPSRSREEPPEESGLELQPEEKALASGTGAGLAFLALALMFAANNFMLSGLSVHMIPLLSALNLTETESVALAALIGPAQVGGRFVELLFGRKLSSLTLGALATFALLVAFGLLATFGVGGFAGIAFACVYGAANGIITVSRGTLPLLLFGRAGYGAVLGRLARPGLAAAALAPFVYALLIDFGGAAWGFEISFASAVLAFGAMLTIYLKFRPR